MNTPAWKALCLLLPVFAIAVALAKINPAGNFWGGVETPKAQCEAYDAIQLGRLPALSPEVYDSEKLNRVIREPQNTLSNLPYIAVGLAVFLAARHLLTRAWALGCIFLGVGSGLYHASLLSEWRLIDILGVYVALFGLIAIGLGSIARSPTQPRQKLATSGLIWVAAFWTGIHRNDVRLGGIKPFDSTYVVVAAITLSSVLALTALRRTKDRKHYFRSLVALIIAAPLAFMGGLEDRFGGFLANPEALIQGHSVWHALGALSLLAAYEVFASTGYDASVFRPRLPASTTRTASLNPS